MEHRFEITKFKTKQTFDFLYTNQTGMYLNSYNQEKWMQKNNSTDYV